MRRISGIAGVPLLALLVACATAATPPPPSSASPSLAPVASAAAPMAERLVPVDVDARAPQPAMAPRYPAAVVGDPCVDRDLPAPVATDIALTVLDRTYALAPDYAPPDLVPASRAGFTGESGDKLVRAVVIEDLARMREAWEAAGLTIEIESAHRDYASQAATFNSWVARLGYAAGLLRSARPGHSEHQLGTALDLTSEGWSGRLGDWAAESAEGAWVAEHAWEHGFVMSYPADSTAGTCFGYEPWHYRWIGRERAAEHRASGLDLREFLERFITG